MLPASHHPLSPPMSSGTPSLAASGLLAPPEPSEHSPRPLFPPDDSDSDEDANSPSPARSALGLNLAHDADDAGYFTPRRRSTAEPADQFLRPTLTSTLTLRAVSLSDQLKSSKSSSVASPDAVDEPLPPEPLPKQLAFPTAPHLLPADSPLLNSLPQEHLLALVRALSRDLARSSEDGQRSERECDALVGMLSDQGVGAGEVKRARVRARIGSTDGRDGAREWKVDLRDPNVMPVPEGVSFPSTPTAESVRAPPIS